MALRGRDCRATEQLVMVVRGLTDLIRESLIWKWYRASLRMSETKRAPTCVGLGTEVQDFVEAVQQELNWWPCQPVPEWLRERITMEPQYPITERLFDEKFRIQEADMDFTLVQEIKVSAHEQVRLLMDHQWNDENERALMADRRHTQSWNEAEQLYLWEFNEGEAA